MIGTLAINKRSERNSAVALAAPETPGRDLGGPLAALIVLLVALGLIAALWYISASPEYLLILGGGALLAALIARWPTIGTFIALPCTILFDTFTSGYANTFFSEFGVFRNLNTHGLPFNFSMFEVLVGFTLAATLLGRLHRGQGIERGALFKPVLAFAGFVLFGEALGMLTGGDFKVSLWEVRPLLYPAGLYLLAVNTISTPRHVRLLIWITVLAIIVRCGDGFVRYLMIPADVRPGVPVILEHDDSLFLVLALALGVAGLLWRRWLSRLMLVAIAILTPAAGAMMLLNGRRAAYMVLFLALATFVPLLWTYFRSRLARRRLLYALAGVVVALAAYLAIFWNASGSIAAPARAVHSVFEPDERDYLSDLYRDQENANLRYTIGTSPLLGIGFGKPMLIIRPMVDLQAAWALQLYMPHNNMLWLWMRMGAGGFAVFWVFIGAILLLTNGCLRLGLHIAYTLQANRTTPATPTRPRRFAAESLAPALVVLRAEPVAPPSPHDLQPPEQRGLRQEIGELMVCAFMAQAMVASLLGIAAVDQGLMSSRLMAFAGLLLGCLAVSWKMLQAVVQLPEFAPLAEQYSQKEDSNAHSERVLVVPRA